MIDTTNTAMTAASPEMWDFFANNWGELVLIVMAAFKAALNLLPSDKPVQVFAYLDSLVNFLISDKLNKRDAE